MVWGLSVVASASISTTVQALAGNSERAVTSLGFNLLLAAVPLVGLAHPGLLLVAGLGISVLALFLGVVELTLNLIA